MSTYPAPGSSPISLYRRLLTGAWSAGAGRPWATGVALLVAMLGAGAVGHAKGKKTEATAAAKKCPVGESSVKVSSVELKLKCKEGFADCETEIPVKAQNCTDGFLEFTKIEMYEHDRRSMVLEFSPASIVPPGGSWKEQIPWTTPGDVEAVVYFRAPGGGGNGDAARGQVKVMNHGLEEAKKSCERCNGTWGKYGINQNEGCNCKTVDAGKLCYDGNECKGECLFFQYDSRGREVGKCSDSVRLSGCLEIVAKGASKLPIRLPPPRKLPTCL